MKILLASQSYDARSKSTTAQELINLYAEMNPEGSKYPFTLYGTPGLREWADLGTLAPVDGMQVMGDNLYAFSDNDVFKISTTKTITDIGDLSGSAGRVDLANNGTQMLVITPDGDGFIVTSSSVAVIADGDFPTASGCTFLDQYFIVSVKDTGQFQWSDILDGTAWDALDFATAEEAPDKLIKPFAFNNSLWLFGGSSIEPHYNTGDLNATFGQIQGAANTTRGCAAAFAVAQEDNGLFFLGEDRVFYRVQGFTPVRISTHALETEWQSYARVDDAVVFIYTQDGHKHIVLTFPSARKTWVFDIASGLWHRRMTGDSIWRANCHAYFNGKHLVGDRSNGKIYEIDMDYFYDDDQLITRIVEGVPAWADGARVTHDMVRLDIDAGLAKVTGQGSDPQVMMKYSDDGKKTWSNERWASMGRIGEYFKRVLWRRLGSFRERVYHFKITDNVPVKITGCYASGRMGRE